VFDAVGIAKSQLVPDIVAALGKRRTSNENCPNKYARCELDDTPNIRHPAFVPVRLFSMPNNEKGDKNAQQRPYQKQLVHKTALLSIWD